MAVKMRLMRMGKKRSPYYRVVVIDGRAPRDGRYIDLLGRYDPNPDPSVIEIDSEKAIDWLAKGAQPTEAVRKLLEITGALSRYKVASGRIHTVGASAPAAGSGAVETAADETAADETASDETASDETTDPSAAAEVDATEADTEETSEPVAEEPTAEEAEADTAGDASEEE